MSAETASKVVLKLRIAAVFVAVFMLSALAIAAHLRPDPKAAAADSPVVKNAAERFIPKDAVKPARTRQGKVS